MTEATITVLNTDQRRFLDAQTQRAREAAQRAAEDALRALAVGELSRPAYLSEEQNGLRLALRDKGRQLGDDTSRTGATLTNLVHDVAYEQWHRLLFARFLEVNELLRHPEYRDIPLSFEDCGDFAPDLGEPDAWAVAARFASEILPGVFRLTDPAVQVRLAAEHRDALERLLLEIPAEVFTTEDALGWVYQFWQTAEKKRVNDSGVKIGGADLSPVTQLFTENYMVRFLLENSLGAWWAARHPESPLVDTWEYLRRNEDGTPAAGSFSDWPEHAADVTVMDPCCGSGHFLVAMFGMLWRMRAEEEGLTPAEAQDAVIRDNLHGLELDPRCTQIATFNVALEAWKQGGFRELPSPQVACSGVPVRSTREEWESLAGSNDVLRSAMSRLHGVFRSAESLGSLIDPRPARERSALFGADGGIGVEWPRLRALLAVAVKAESQDQTVLGHTANDILQAAELLGGSYTLVATNPPYLQRNRMDEPLTAHIDAFYPLGRSDIATAMIERCLDLLDAGGTIAVVAPQNWLSQTTYTDFREQILTERSIDLVARLGEGAFTSSAAAGAFVALYLITNSVGEMIQFLDAHEPRRPEEKSAVLREGAFISVRSKDALAAPDHRVSTTVFTGTLLGDYADAYQGIKTGDDGRYRRYFWEVEDWGKWSLFVSSVDDTVDYGGRSYVVDWRGGRGPMVDSSGSRIVGKSAWGRRGVLVSQMRELPVSLYFGELFDTNASPVIPKNPADLPAVYAYLSSEEYCRDVRRIEPALKVTNSTLVKVPFDIDRWRAAAAEAGLLPSATTNDPAQWGISGSVGDSSEPLQVAVARVLGYRWPEHTSVELDSYADDDGIAALVALPGEPDLVTRLREALAVAYGSEWSSTTERRLVVEAGGKNGRLEDWLRDSFFAQHVRVFDNRPFLWHIWDSRKDGFSAIVNYHKLDRRTLEKLTFTSLGSWIDRQKHEARAERAGADARLAAAEDLQRRLKLILDGAPPYDMYVRWKSMAEQPIGWEPDLDDGVRLNIRPFVTAGVLRSKVSVHWKKDRGTNPDGSERHNDLHPTLDERRAARKAAEAAE
ncbi:N-6 DNA methylase [Microbacterium sp. NPDC076768]|uniref:N-6 DNA methylase n=1 Tax=Microbacterium sp. NPDC076768 TaxID=3154858 RepID=UPI003445798B